MIIRKNNPAYAHLFTTKIPNLVDKSTHKKNSHIGRHTVTVIRIEALIEIKGLYMTNDYEGILTNIDTLYPIDED